MLPSDDDLLMHYLIGLVAAFLLGGIFGALLCGTVRTM